MLSATDSQAQSVSGRPLKIFSGDRLLLMSEDNIPYRIALAGIQAPPLDSRWGVAAKRHLGILVLGRVVTIEFLQQREEAGDQPARVLLGGADINLRLIQAGLARHAQHGQARAARIEYAEAEKQARIAGQGLWSKDRSVHRSHTRTLPGGPVPPLGR